MKRMMSNCKKTSIESLQNLFDKKQLEYMVEDKCIQVNEKDEILGYISKKDCHLMSNINKGILHRAFSLFLFDSKENLLIQQRSIEKITYPLHFTNTCCSHPLFVENEKCGKQGVFNAASRKLNHELGIDVESNKMNFIGRIVYSAQNNIPDSKDEFKEDINKYMLFGENEIDYLIISKLDHEGKDINDIINKNEVNLAKWVSKSQLNEMIEDDSYIFTPWFKLIKSYGILERIWSNLSNLEIIVENSIVDLRK